MWHRVPTSLTKVCKFYLLSKHLNAVIEFCESPTIHISSLKYSLLDNRLLVTYSTYMLFIIPPAQLKSVFATLRKHCLTVFQFRIYLSYLSFRHAISHESLHSFGIEVSYSKCIKLKTVWLDGFVEFSIQSILIAHVVG